MLRSLFEASNCGDLAPAQEVMWTLPSKRSNKTFGPPREVFRAKV